VDAWQAMDQLGQQNIDLIILDLRMPGPVDGEQLLFALRDQGNDVPVIVLSGWVDDDISNAPPDCVHAVLKKPIRIDSVAETVASVLGEAPATLNS
jgi:DNA-binding NtrC family response regulator